MQCRVFLTVSSFILFRSMCTVLVSSSVRCASGNCQIQKGVIGKSPWLKTNWIEPLSGDVCNQSPRRDQAYRRSLINLRNLFKIGLVGFAFNRINLILLLPMQLQWYVCYWRKSLVHPPSPLEIIRHDKIDKF